MTRHIVITIGLLVLVTTNVAHAGGNELQVTIGPGYSSLPDFGEGLDGVGGGGELTYLFDGFWSVAAGAHFAHHFGETLEDTTFVDTNVLNVWLGPKFNLDYFVVIPFISLAPELILTDGELAEEQEELDFGIRWTFGFDYRPVRNWSAGFEVNYHSFIAAPINYPVYITTLFRLSFHYGFDDL